MERRRSLEGEGWPATLRLRGQARAGATFPASFIAAGGSPGVVFVGRALAIFVVAFLFEQIDLDSCTVLETGLLDSRSHDR